MEQGKRVYIIKWINKYSKEVGYVRYIKEEKGHFVNTYERSNAGKYRSQEDAEKAVGVLHVIGEAKFNDFVIESYIQ